MKFGHGRRLAASGALVLLVGGLAACLPGGGDPPPPPWCHPSGIQLLESSLVDAQTIGADHLVEVIEWKLLQCEGTTDGGDGGGDGGDDDGGDDGGGGLIALCHAQGNGTFVLKLVNPNAFDGHIGHGDVHPVPPGGCGSIET